MKKLAFFVLLPLLTIACKYNLGDTLTIHYGETIEIPSENLKITFSDLNDSRCPKGVQCVTQGQARAVLTVDKGGNSESVELTSEGLCFDETGPCGSEVTAMGYRFQLLYIYPHPEKDVTVDLKGYSLKVIVTIYQTN
ncbi:MAG: hypothetical protein IPL49_08375 [Saprospirales bacterium]|nr:hypothetical protein [Saprospirales bacterium]MBK8490888.1 hypothetical protein [Saprospirales bacterium]